ncbi:MarR family winged helix-turn-helix transcriptional regulator [Jatrophihabitans sp. YIM 134969]
MAMNAPLARPSTTTVGAPPAHRPAAPTAPPMPSAPLSSTMNTEGQELITAWGLVLEATSFTSQRLSEGLERAGVSAPFFDVLVRLAREPSQRLPMTKLATEVSLTSGGFTKLADRMEQEGLLYRQHSAQDRRVIYAVLTDAGRAAAAKIFPSHVADLRRHVESVLGVDGAAQLAALCRKLRDANATP